MVLRLTFGQGDEFPSREMSLSATGPTRIGAVEAAVEGKTAATKPAGGNGQFGTPDNAFATRATGHSDRFAPHRDLVYSRTLAAADTVAAAFGLLLSMMIVGQDHPALPTLAVAPLIVGLGKVIGVYDRAEWRVRKSTLDEGPRLFQVAILFAITIWLINGLLVTHTTDRHELSRGVPGDFHHVACAPCARSLGMQAYDTARALLGDRGWPDVRAHPHKDVGNRRDARNRRCACGD